MQRVDSLGKALGLGKIEGKGKGGSRGLDGQINGHEFEQTPSDSKEQGNLACFHEVATKLQRVRYNLATEQQQQILNGTEIGQHSQSFILNIQIIMQV